MAWNYFDSFAVAIGLVEAITDLVAGTDATSGVSGLLVIRIIRIASILRAIRVVRLMHFVRTLRDLIVSIAYTMRYLASTDGMVEDATQEDGPANSLTFEDELLTFEDELGNPEEEGGLAGPHERQVFSEVLLAAHEDWLDQMLAEEQAG